MGVNGFSSRVLKIQNKLTIACETIVNHKLSSVNEQHSAPSWVSMKSGIIPLQQKDGFRLSSASHGRAWLSMLFYFPSSLAANKCAVRFPLVTAHQLGVPLKSAALIRRGATSGCSSALSFKTAINPPTN